ncbi:lysylphosphatidylglycerol synthase transmembrane domain-containing protein [Polynucleobacter sp. AM-26B4]|uniref:lysylphosphatidylglycerol synthase transmembrane domain-containing protein n=1 Tax=Polynucleobacter sp. AM-26B4 TaxID=2689103 RepID=UPI001C0CA303|nr:lysylphosphatidylglycerol synthase transmembrane domain-containing protein [Polynucleobacter sp. AM-26B4]MBU3585171.1 flippase-like domain-containing protein [Polynucleobacter sp. AM-26B4]
MKIGKAAIGFFLLTCFYLGLLLWVYAKNHVLTQINLLVHAIPFLLGISLVSYLLRYLRWYWILARSGYQVNWLYGFIAYLSGFAFTATPGKVGELIRIRYFSRVGVPANISFGAFIYERALDLIVVLLLASLVISRFDLLILALSFVVIFISLLFGIAMNPRFLTQLSTFLNSYSWSRIARLIMVVRDGLSSCRLWCKPLDLIISIGYGVLAWSLTSYGFMWLLSDLGLSIQPLEAFTIYPLAMLAGAASMLPGGVGSTELTIILLLGVYGVTVSIATIAAIGIRFATIWFAVLTGFICIGILEVWKPKLDSPNI